MATILGSRDWCRMRGNSVCTDYYCIRRTHGGLAENHADRDRSASSADLLSLSASH